MAQYYLSLGRERVGRDYGRLVDIVGVLLVPVCVAAEPMLRGDPQLPAEGLVLVLQVMFLLGLSEVTCKRMVKVFSEQFYFILFYDNPRLSFSLLKMNWA